MNFDDVRDYNFVDNGARDANGNAIPGLEQYTVQISAVARRPLGAVPNAIRRSTCTVTYRPEWRCLAAHRFPD